MPPVTWEDEVFSHMSVTHAPLGRCALYTLRRRRWLPHHRRDSRNWKCYGAKISFVLSSLDCDGIYPREHYISTVDIVDTDCVSSNASTSTQAIYSLITPNSNSRHCSPLYLTPCLTNSTSAASKRVLGNLYTLKFLSASLRASHVSVYI